MIKKFTRLANFYKVLAILVLFFLLDFFLNRRIYIKPEFDNSLDNSPNSTKINPILINNNSNLSKYLTNCSYEIEIKSSNNLMFLFLHFKLDFFSSNKVFIK